MLNTYVKLSPNEIEREIESKKKRQKRIRTATDTQRERKKTHTIYMNTKIDIYSLRWSLSSFQCSLFHQLRLIYLTRFVHCSACTKHRFVSQSRPNRQEFNKCNFGFLFVKLWKIHFSHRLPVSFQISLIIGRCVWLSQKKILATIQQFVWEFLVFLFILQIRT